jgi:DNA polymerase I
MRLIPVAASDNRQVSAAGVTEELRRAGVGRGDLVGLAVSGNAGLAVGGNAGLGLTGDAGLGLATAAGGWPVRPGPGELAAGELAAGELAAAVGLADDALRPRWVVWSGDTAAALAASGVRLATCWDIAAVHRLLFGGWRADPAWVWAHLRRLGPETIPVAGPPDLFQQAEPDSGQDPVGPDGHLRPGWASGGWSASPDRLARWAELAVTVAGLQQAALAELDGAAGVAATARSESAAELLCAELSADGLPMDRAAAEQILSGLIGPRPRGEAEAAQVRAARDAAVLRHVPPGVTVDLRSPAQVRALLARVGVDVPDTRAWRLKLFRDAHPVVGALLEWRKAERIATTYGYAWLDEHLGQDGRLRGAWTGSDGAAGRMTASGGLHNMPAAMRPAVAAEPGHVFVRADLGQIEPRVLAAVSGDRALAAATRADDLYAPVAGQLGVDRPTAKVAVLGAMYGQTTGHGAQVLRRLKTAYPVAIAYLEEGDRAGRAGRELRTYGGRRIPMAPPADGEPSARAAARGRYGRNALIQGAAAELFKMWAVTVRARAQALGARIVLCLHDELLVHAPAEHAEAVSRLVDECLAETARRWAPDGSVRFIADTSIVRRWSDAKDAKDAKDGTAPAGPMLPGASKD